MGSSLVVSTFTLLCNQSSETFSFCKTEAPYPLSSNSLPPVSSPARHRGFCLCDFDSSRHLCGCQIRVSLCDGLTSLSITSSRPVSVVINCVCHSVCQNFFLRLNNILLYEYTHFWGFLSIVYIEKSAYFKAYTFFTKWTLLLY